MAYIGNVSAFEWQELLFLHPSEQLCSVCALVDGSVSSYHGNLIGVIISQSLEAVFQLIV